MKMSITRALAEIKRLDDRINREIMNGTFVGVTVGKNQLRKMHQGNQTISDAEAAIKGSFQRVDALMRNRERIKAAVVKSNATVEVTIGDRTLTVAEAIELKKSVSLKETYLVQLRRHLQAATINIEAIREKMQQSIDRSIDAVYSSGSTQKVTSEQYDAVAKPQEERSTPALLDPADIASRITALEADVSLVKTELDFVLSESNARTDIDVDLDSV